MKTAAGSPKVQLLGNISLSGVKDGMKATEICCTFDHSLALCLVRTALLSSAYRAPMKEPMDVPPTMSIGIPASSMAFITPTCEQPLQRTDDASLQRCVSAAPSMPTAVTAHLAPPPPRTRAMLFPVRTRASREKSLCLSAVFSNTFS